MSEHRTSVLPLLIAMLLPAGASYAAAPAAAPATAPASAPATQPDTPRDAATQFFVAASQGDRDAVFSRLWLVDDSAKKEADVVIGLEMLKLQFDKALTEVFSEAPSDNVTGTAKAVEEIAAQLKTADITVNGDSAQVKPSAGPTFYLVRHDGRWQIDFVQMQVNDAGGRELPADVDAKLPQVKIYEQAIADVRAKKYKTADDARAELNRRLAPLTKAVPSATRPAGPPATDLP